MADFLKSAFGMFSSGNGDSSCKDFTGQNIEIGKLTLKVKRVLASGGFAIVFETADIHSGKVYALKRLLSHDKETNEKIIKEINFMKKLGNHPNIIKFYAAASSTNERQGGNEYLILMEMCTGGNLTEYLQSRYLLGSLSLSNVVIFFYQAALAVQYLHTQSPPIIHRDLKIENLLLTSSDSNRIKLCDFGSATTTAHYPDHDWTALRRSLVEDEIITNTTPMYRTPEVLDLYQNFPINEAQDIWALGCILYLLCYGVHPFEDSAKLKILNANYSLPENDTKYSVFHDLIIGCLQIDPTKRPAASEVIDRISEIAEAHGVNVNLNNEPTKAVPPSRPPPPSMPIPEPAPENTGKIINSIKGGAGVFLQNVRDASSRVVETVSSYTKGDLDISYITSRLIVMSQPGEGVVEAAYRNNIDDVRLFLDSRHPGHYAVYNLTTRSYNYAKFQRRVSDCGWSCKRAPSLLNLFTICDNMVKYLRLDPKNVCVVHCTDGKAQSALVICALIAFCRLYLNPASSLHLFTLRRGPAGILPSQLRYIDYVGDVLCGDSIKPHFNYIKLKKIIMKPVPMMNKARSGCKPFCEIFVGEQRVFSSSEEYANLRGFEVTDRCAEIPINFDLQGDVFIVMFHARSSFGGKVQSKISSIKMFQVQFNTGYVPHSATSLRYVRSELDLLESQDRYPDLFAFILEFEVIDKVFQPKTPKVPWENLNMTHLQPDLLVSNEEELNTIYKEVGRPNEKLNKAHEGFFTLKGENAAESIPENVPKENAGGFFEAPEWKEHKQDTFTREFEALTDSRMKSPEVKLIDFAGENEEILADSSPFSSGFNSTNANQSNDLNFFDLPANPPSGGSAQQSSANFQSEFFSENSNNIYTNVFLLDGNKESSSTKKQNQPDPFSNMNLLGDDIGSSKQSQSHPDLESLFTGSNLPSSAKQSSQTNLFDSNFGSEFDNLKPNTSFQTNNLFSSNQSLFNPPASFSGRSSPQPAKTSTSSNSATKKPMSATASPKFPRSVYNTDTHTKPKPKADFSDLLSSSGFTCSSQQSMEPKTLKEMRNLALQETVHPDVLKIRDWTAGKEGNIRALLGSLSQVLWEDARWTDCGMHQLVTAAQVKKAWRSALLAVHPDKQVGSVNENLARLIMIELNEAWDEFQNSGAKSLY